MSNKIGLRNNSGKIQYGLVPGSVWRVLEDYLDEFPAPKGCEISDVMDSMYSWMNNKEACNNYLPKAYFQLSNVIDRDVDIINVFCSTTVEATRVLEFGAEKYAPNNWRLGGKNLSATNIFSSFLRHCESYLSGVTLDLPTDLVEAHLDRSWYIGNGFSGLPHLGHIGCNILFMIYFSVNGDRFIDDRFDSK